MCKLYNSILLIVLITGLIGCSQSEILRLEPKEFQTKINATQNSQVIDVRTPEEFSNGHLINAININFQDSSFKTLLAELNINLPVFVYCQAGTKGGRSDQTVLILNTMKFIEVYELSGGIANWQKTLDISK